MSLSNLNSGQIINNVVSGRRRVYVWAGMSTHTVHTVVSNITHKTVNHLNVMTPVRGWWGDRRFGLGQKKHCFTHIPFNICLILSKPLKGVRDVDQISTIPLFNPDNRPLSCLKNLPLVGKLFISQQWSLTFWTREIISQVFHIKFFSEVNKTLIFFFSSSLMTWGERMAA